MIPIKPNYSFNNMAVTVTDTSVKCNISVLDNIWSNKCNTKFVMVLLPWSYPGNDANCNNIIFVAASHQIGLDTRPMTRRPIVVGI